MPSDGAGWIQDASSLGAGTARPRKTVPLMEAHRTKPSSPLSGIHPAHDADGGLSVYN